MFPLAHPVMSCCFEHDTEYSSFGHLCGMAAVLGQRQEVSTVTEFIYLFCDVDVFMKDIIWFVLNL